MPRPPRDLPFTVAWRRRLVLLVTLIGLAGVLAGAVALGRGVVSGGGSDEPAPKAPRTVEISAGRRVVLRLAPAGELARSAAGMRRALEGRLPRAVVASRGRARIVYRYDVDATARKARAAGNAGGRVTAVRRAVSSNILAPVVRQSRRNTCESAALEILLATTGKRISQNRIQAAFPRSGALDPRGTGTERIWGDPDRGYVGREDGGGPAGGFGVYPGPVAATARELGRDLVDLSGSAPDRLYARLLRGRAVMVWIGLSAGPYGEWRAPDGRRVRVNFGEHTIVLTGMARDGSLRAVNPLEGTAEVWPRDRFEAAWELLGRRALGA